MHEDVSFLLSKDGWNGLIIDNRELLELGGKNLQKTGKIASSVALMRHDCRSQPRKWDKEFLKRTLQ
jgi:hypothetical protein